MTPTIHLDPDALEAAAKAHIANTVSATYSVTGLPAAITAYLAAIEPRLRERMLDFATKQFLYGNHPGLSGRREEAYESKDALFALFGLEPSE